MAENTRRNWYIAFGAILTALGTFLVTTDPIFNYSDLLKPTPKVDPTQIVTTVPKNTLDTLLTIEPEIWTLPRISKEVKYLKDLNMKHDSIIHKVILGDR